MASSKELQETSAPVERDDALLPEKASSVLIAEDELLVARSLQQDLESLGYTIVGPAANGARAVELAREHRPDIALLDLRMPEMDGLEAVRLIYQEMGIPVVVVSAFSDRQYIDMANEISVFGYVLKPVGAEALRVALAVAWQRYVEHLQLTHQLGALEQKLEHRKVIERAKGLIMETLGLSESQAMRRLQKQSRDSRRPMVELARAVLDAQELLDQKTDGADQGE